MTAHPAIAAVPKNGEPNRAALQTLLIQRTIYWMDPDEDPETFDPRGDGTGAVVQVIFWRGNFYELDADDSTTEADWTSVLVTTPSGGRYKITFDDILFQFSVLSKTVTTPPDLDDEDEEARPNYGDAYLVPDGASGDWATHADDVAILTTRDTWTYVAPRDGRLVRVRDSKAFWHYDADDGAWVRGFGAAALADNTIIASQMLGGGGELTHIVENQTTNDPPGTVVNGVKYVIGSEPTAAWTGLTGKIAMGEAGAWVVYTPAEGWRIYDKGTSGAYNFSGGIWLSGFGRFLITRRVYRANATWTKPSRLFLLKIVAVIGAGKNAGTGNGGASSFGAHCSATGGGTSPGVGSGGDINLAGEKGGSFSSGASTLGRSGAGAGPYGGRSAWAADAVGNDFGGGGCASASSGGAGGGHSEKIVVEASLGTTEAVTVGLGSGTSATKGADGAVIIEEYTFT